MARSHLHASLILCISIAAAQLMLFLISQRYEARDTTPNCAPRNVEEHLACGVPVAFSNLSVIDLEEIPGISAPIAARLFGQKRAVSELAASLPEPLRYRALLVVKGIGPQKSERIGRYLDLTR